MHPKTRRGAALLAALLIGLAAPGCGDDDAGTNDNDNENQQPPEWNVGTLLAWVDDGLLAEVETPNGPLRILRVQGSHYEMGYQYGYLLNAHIQAIWDELFGPLMAEELGLPEEMAVDLFDTLMDLAWSHVLPHMPQNYLDELDGVVDGATAAGHPRPDDVGDIVRRVMMLVDTSQAEAFGGDVGEMTTFYTRGLSPGAEEYFGLAEARGDTEGLDQAMALEGQYVPAPFREALRRLSPMKTCSFFAAWGDRTEGGRQIATRVLDWSADMGLGRFGLITVFVPDNGAAHVTVGYVSMISALAGMNEHGIALGAVGSGSVLERLGTMSISVKGREFLEQAHDLDSAFPYLTGEVDDGLSRAPSVGTNVMVAYGDPAGGGAGAEGAVSEFDGVWASLFRYGPFGECAESAFLYEFGQDGQVANQWNHLDHPDTVNLEGEAFEIDADGNLRLFQVDAGGEFVRDATGWLVEDATGMPYPVGMPLPCALFRSGEAMAHGVRRWQVASSGPRSGSAHKLMHLSGSHREMYLGQGQMLDAFYQGAAFEWEGDLLIPDNGGQQVPIGPEQAQDIIWLAAMSSNVYAVVYDTTNLVMWVAYERGEGESWSRAANNEYFRLDLADLLPAP